MRLLYLSGIIAAKDSFKPKWIPWVREWKNSEQDVLAQACGNVTH